jgi:ribosomal protein S18 acetylase RimI-like enzyme
MLDTKPQKVSIGSLPPDLSMKKLTQAELPSLIACVQASFPAPHGEVMARHLGIYPIDYLRYTEKVCAKAVDDDLTYVICHKPTGEVVSFLICEALVSAPQYSTMDISPKFKPLIAILESLDRRYQDDRKEGLDDTLHLYMLGTAPHYRRFGLGEILVTFVSEQARRQGFARIIAEATGPGSQSLFKRLGFTTRFEESYQDYQLGHDKPFEDLTGATHCKLVELCI